MALANQGATPTSRIGPGGPHVSDFMPDLVEGTADDIERARREAARKAEDARRESEQASREAAGLHPVNTTSSLARGFSLCGACGEPATEVLVALGDKMVCPSCYAKRRGTEFGTVRPAKDVECRACGGTGRVDGDEH